MYRPIYGISGQRLYHSLSRATSRIPPCHGTTSLQLYDTLSSRRSRTPQLSLYSNSLLPTRSQNSITVQSTFNFFPLHPTFSQRPTQRIILRSLTSDSKNQRPEDGQANDPISTKDSSEGSTQSTSGAAISETTKPSAATKENAPFRELVDTVDTRIQVVRGKVSPKDLLYYFALLTTFVILVVGPLVARYVGWSFYPQHCRYIF